MAEIPPPLEVWVTFRGNAGEEYDELVGASFIQHPVGAKCSQVRYILAPAAPASAEGGKWTPREPTEDMLNALCDKMWRDHTAQGVWRAMHDAAPAAETQTASGPQPQASSGVASDGMTAGSEATPQRCVIEWHDRHADSSMYVEDDYEKAKALARNIAKKMRKRRQDKKPLVEREFGGEGLLFTVYYCEAEGDGVSVYRAIERERSGG